MIANSTLQIMKITETDWNLLSVKDKIKLVRKKLKLIHPDHNNGQDKECKELLEYYKYLREENNQYLKTYLPEAQQTEINGGVSVKNPRSSKYKSQQPIESAQDFFSDFKETVKTTFNHDWDQAYKAIFIVINEKRNHLSEQDELRSFVSPYKFHILQLAHYYKNTAQSFSISPINGHAQEADFDKALAYIYFLIQFEDPCTYITPTSALPPSFLEDRKLSLKIHSFFPQIITIARSYGFPGFWQDENFWIEAINVNPKVFDFFHHFSPEDKKFLTDKLAKQFGDAIYMESIISRNPKAAYFLGKDLKYDVTLLSQAIGGLSYSHDAMQELCNTLPSEMLEINSPLAKTVLNEIDASLLAFFKNTDSKLYFKYLHQACCTLDTALEGDYISGFKSERSVFIKSLPEQEQAYTQEVCTLVDKLNVYQRQLIQKTQSQSYCFFPYKLQTYTQPIDELKKFLMGKGGDIQMLNKFLPALYTSSLRPDIEKWLVYKNINPTLEDIRFEPNKLKKLYELLTSSGTYQGLMLVGYVALLCQGIASALMLSVAIVACLIALQKVFYDNDDRHFVQPSF